MYKIREFKCKYCGKGFANKYKISNNKILKFCSKSCKTKFQKQGYYNKSQLENAIIKLIKREERYLTKNEILEFLKISSKTLSSFRISILTLNNKCKMTKPKSMFEFFVEKELKKIFKGYNFEKEKSFKDLKSTKGSPLFFDFYFENLNLLIECDGKQHEDINNPRYTKILKENDCIKNEYCKQNNIHLVRISYNRKVTYEYIHNFVKGFKTKEEMETLYLNV